MTGPRIEHLFRAHAPYLQRLVRRDVRASSATIEDACQVAWARLVAHREAIADETAIAWLATTAVREALRLIREEARTDSLEEAVERAGDTVRLGAGLDVAERYGAHERLRALRALPPRQERLLWLQGLGLSYAEMAAHERCTVRTVERQILRGRCGVRRLLADVS